MEFVSKWYEEGKDEIKKASFACAQDTVTKGEPIDFISWFCGIFALSCLVIVAYFGISRGITAPMIYLMVLYVLIAIFSLCQPVQIKISKCLWGFGFKNRIAVNKGYNPVVRIEDDKVTITGEKGEEVYTVNEDCFFVQSSGYVIMHITDKKLFTVLKVELEEEGKLEEMLSLCINQLNKEQEVLSSDEKDTKEDEIEGVATEDNSEEAETEDISDKKDAESDKTEEATEEVESIEAADEENESTEAADEENFETEN